MILPDDTPASPSKLHPDSEDSLPVERAVPEHQFQPPPAYSGPANPLPQPVLPHSPYSPASSSSYPAPQAIYIRVDPSDPNLPLNRLLGDQDAQACRKAARRLFFRSFAVALLIYIVFVSFVSTMLGVSMKSRVSTFPDPHHQLDVWC